MNFQKEKITRESMVFYDSFYKAIKDLPAEQFKECACAIFDYGFDGEEPACCGLIKTVFTLAKPQIDKNNQRYLNAKRSGSEQTVSNPEQTNSNSLQTRATHKKAVPNVNENEKAKENENDNAHVNENINKKSSAQTAEENKHAHGEYKNVFLTKEQEKQLIDELGKEKYSSALSYLSRYIARKPNYKSASHFEDLRGWVLDACSKNEKASSGSKTEGTKKSSLYDINLEDLFEK